MVSYYLPIQFMALNPILKKTRLGQHGANISPDRSSLTPQVLIGNFLKHNYPLLYELQHINLLCLYLPKEDGVSPDAEYITQTRLGQLGANISPDRSSLTPQVLIGNFVKHNYPLLYELQHINLLCLYLPKEDGVSPDAEYITQIIFSIFLQ